MRTELGCVKYSFSFFIWKLDVNLIQYFPVYTQLYIYIWCCERVMLFSVCAPFRGCCGFMSRIPLYGKNIFEKKILLKRVDIFFFFNLYRYSNNKHKSGPWCYENTEKTFCIYIPIASNKIEHSKFSDEQIICSIHFKRL